MLAPSIALQARASQATPAEALLHSCCSSNPIGCNLRRHLREPPDIAAPADVGRDQLLQHSFHHFAITALAVLLPLGSTAGSSLGTAPPRLELNGMSYRSWERE